MKAITFSLFLFMLCLWSGVAGQNAEAVLRVSLTVGDLDRAVKFYTEVLDFQKESEYRLDDEATQKLFGLQEKTAAVRIAHLKIGGETVELMEFSGTSPGRSIPADSRSNDGWFQHIAIVVSDMELAYKKLRQHNVVHVSTSPQTLPAYIPAAAGISAFYFRDPDGHNLEIIHFPPGKGNPKWQQLVVGISQSVASQSPITHHPSPVTLHQSPFLGIDHTAIGIEETGDGFAFWRDILKLKVAGNSENYGTEQEHLNQVFGARLLITGLQSEAGFGVEFLDYIAPPGGRPYPADSRPTDLWHWHTTLKVNELEQLQGELLSGGFRLISQGIVQLDKNKKALLVRDPDGHAVLLEEEKPASER